MLLGVAWRDAGPEIDRMSRYESRLRVRYEKAIKRLDSLIATRPQQEPAADPIPAPHPPTPPKEDLPNEPNSDLFPIPATPPSSDPALAVSSSALPDADRSLQPVSSHPADYRNSQDAFTEPPK